jgi:Flp pilus assembly pilin Flp
MLRRFLKEKSGAAAVELAAVSPLLCLVLLGIIDGWSHSTHTLNMRAAVKAGANYVMQGGTSGTLTQNVAMSAWLQPPADAAVTVDELCYCGTVASQCDILCSSNGKAPSSYYRIAATGTWTPLVPVRLVLEGGKTEQSEMIRVR